MNRTPSKPRRVRYEFVVIEDGVEVMRRARNRIYTHAVTCSDPATATGRRVLHFCPTMDQANAKARGCSTVRHKLQGQVNGKLRITSGDLIYSGVRVVPLVKVDRLAGAEPPAQAPTDPVRCLVLPPPTGDALLVREALADKLARGYAVVGLAVYRQRSPETSRTARRLNALVEARRLAPDAFYLQAPGLLPDGRDFDAYLVQTIYDGTAYRVRDDR